MGSGISRFCRFTITVYYYHTAYYLPAAVHLPVQAHHHYLSFPQTCTIFSSFIYTTFYHTHRIPAFVLLLPTCYCTLPATSFLRFPLPVLAFIHTHHLPNTLVPIFWRNAGSCRSRDMRLVYHTCLSWFEFFWFTSSRRRYRPMILHIPCRLYAHARTPDLHYCRRYAFCSLRFGFLAAFWFCTP